MIPLIRTERLQLDALSEQDALFFLQLLNTPSWLRYIGDRNVHSVEEAAAYLLNGPIPHYSGYGFGMRRLRLVATHEPIGICGLVKRDGLACPDLGFALLPEFEGMGLAFEAARAVLVEDAQRMPVISAITDPDNTRSIGLLHRLGFRQDGTIRLPGEDADLQYFLLDREVS